MLAMLAMLARSQIFGTGNEFFSEEECHETFSFTCSSRVLHEPLSLILAIYFFSFVRRFKSQSKTTLGSSPSSHQALNVLSTATVDNNNIAPHHSSTANVQNNPFRRTFDLKLVNHQYGFNSFKTCPTMATSTGSNVMPTFPKRYFHRFCPSFGCFLSCSEDSKNAYVFFVCVCSEVIDSFTLKRLMGASSFGYGEKLNYEHYLRCQ